MDEDFLGRYEYQDGKSHKFYEIIKVVGEEDCEEYIEHVDYNFIWGRIGTEGTSAIGKTYIEARKKAKEKIKKGYVRVDTDIVDIISDDSFNFLEELKSL